jgi:hypothetical protein
MVNMGLIRTRVLRTIFLCMVSTSAFAQSERGQISVTVVDSAGATIPNAVAVIGTRKN